MLVVAEIGRKTRSRICIQKLYLDERQRLAENVGDEVVVAGSVNPTPHGTMIVIPRHWSLDPHRDLAWKFIGKLHRAHGARRQGRKLSAGRMERMAEARKAKRLWAEARRKGLRGERRYEYVRERMGRDQRMGPGWLKRLLSGSTA